MSHRGPRIAVVVLVVLAFGVAAWRLWTTDRQRSAGLEANRAFEASTRAIVLALADLRAAQQAYVAAGQGGAFWTARAVSLYTTIETKIAETRRLVTSPEAGQALEATAELLESFRTTDEHAREYVAREQLLLASDLVFGDGAAAAAACAARIEEAQSRESSARQQERARLRLADIVTLGIAAAAALVGLLLLMPRPRSEARVVPTESVVPTASAAVPKPAPPSPPAEPRLDLAAVAALCTDFSRAGDPTALAGLIGRAAGLLDASGAIVWMKDPAAQSLRPVLSHGYSEQALARIGSLSTDADNATAEAYRTGEVRIFEGRGLTHGAIATPLITPAGCVGVLAAEVRAGRETSPVDQAVAAIVAAQLASLVSSSPGTS